MDKIRLDSFGLIELTQATGIDEKIIKDLFTGEIELSDLSTEDLDKLKAFLKADDQEILDLLD